ncbi:MAG: hypothetical protein LWX01_06050 [Deltaproteobacteria bacterium]|nr:hypothetical protein [Deltaproteobacteria bacterium]MDL1961249.1 hypothetical protein [Deltaproteobacteria bacterium]
MSDTQSSTSLADKPRAKALTWRGLILRILVGYVLFVVVSQLFFPFPTGDNRTAAQKIVEAAIGNLMQFLAILAATSLIAVLIAKVPYSNRTKPLTPFLSGALFATLLISGLLIYGGWYATKSASNHNSAQSRVVGGVTSLGGVPAKPDHFIQYSYPNDGFEAAFPSKPSEIRTDKGLEHGYVNSYQAVVVNPTSQYSVFVNHSPKKVFEDASIDAYLDGFLRGLVMISDNASLKYKRLTRFIGFPAMEYKYTHTIEGVPFVGHGIVFIVDGDHIRLSHIYTANDHSADEHFQRFIGSFQLMPVDVPLCSQRFEDRKRGISFSPPEGWKKGTPKYGQVVAIFSNPAGHSITVFDSGVPAYSCENYKYEMQTTQGLQAEGNTKLQGRPVTWLKSTAHNAAAKIRMTSIHYCVNTASGAIILIGAAPEETFFRSETIFRKAAASMVVRK